MGRVCRLFQLVQRAVGGGDQRLVAAVSGINHMEYLFQSIVGATLHAEVVNDKQRIAAKAGNILIPACKAGREVAQDNGEVRHIYGDFFLHEGVCDTARNTNLSEIDYSVVSALCNDLMESGGKDQVGLASKTVADALSLTKAVIKYASRMKYMTDRTALDVSVKVKTHLLGC